MEAERWLRAILHLDSNQDYNSATNAFWNKGLGNTLRYLKTQHCPMRSGNLPGLIWRQHGSAARHLLSARCRWPTINHGFTRSAVTFSTISSSSKAVLIPESITPRVTRFYWKCAQGWTSWRCSADRRTTSRDGKIYAGNVCCLPYDSSVRNICQIALIRAMSAKG